METKIYQFDQMRSKCSSTNYVFDIFLILKLKELTDIPQKSHH